MIEMETIALHVIVVGFHHKKGMMVEYTYPPFPNGDLPDQWKHLPSLCLPDGAHNHEADTVYFHLPSLNDPTRTVFGVSCYRQIDAKKVHNKSADITRNTVQKSVCVLTTLPIYGYIQERLRATTKVYFKEADFSDVRDLEGLYNDLNTTNWKDRLMHGICVSDAVRMFGRNILVLFKLLLLERKVLFFHSPVEPLVKTIISLLTLLPATLPEGVYEAAASSNQAEISSEFKDLSEADVQIENADTSWENDAKQDDHLPGIPHSNPEIGSMINAATQKILDSVVDDIVSPDDTSTTSSSLTSVTSKESLPSDFNFHQLETTTESNLGFTSRMSNLRGRLSGAFNYWTTKDKSTDKMSGPVTPNPSPCETGDRVPASPNPWSSLELNNDADTNQDASTDMISAYHLQLSKYAALTPKSCGLPLALFTQGNVVHPYLSLQFLDVLNQTTTRAFIVGASNTLFIHKKYLYDAIIHLKDGKIEITDADLRKQLHLSMEDLRFSESIIRQVEAVSSVEPSISQQPDVFLDGVGWMGGEEWLRHQFKIYLLSMLRTAGSKNSYMYNPCFVNAWKETNNYRMWAKNGPYNELDILVPGHPNAGNLSLSDMRIRLSQTILTFDRTKRLNDTLATTGTAVVKTKEVVGGALTSARGAISNLWSSFTSNEKVIENTTEDISQFNTELQVTNDLLEPKLLDE